MPQQCEVVVGSHATVPSIPVWAVSQKQPSTLNSETWWFGMRSLGVMIPKASKSGLIGASQLLAEEDPQDPALKQHELKHWSAESSWQVWLRFSHVCWALTPGLPEIANTASITAK